MRLSALAAEVPHRRGGAPGDPEISAITHDSRRSGPGTLFAAFPGTRSDGRSFLPDAIARGASAALGLAPVPDALAVPYLEVENPRRSAGLLAATLTGHPSERLVMAGITGTSGKTTTTFLLDRILAARHEKRGFFGTLVYRGAGGDAAAIAAPRTTPEATDLQPMLAALVKEGGTAASMECSSHALALDRLAGCEFDVAVFLNISRDHLDFHHTLDEYFEAKTRLFEMLKPNGRAVVNVGDKYGRVLFDRLVSSRYSAVEGKDVIGFCLEGEYPEQVAAAGQGRVAGAAASIVVGRATLSTTGTRLEVSSFGAPFIFEEKTQAARAPLKLEKAAGGQNPIPFEEKTRLSGAPLKRARTTSGAALLTIDSPLLGKPNAENLLAAATAGLVLGFSPSEIETALASVTVIPGRLERIPNSRGLTVLVDYAHKPGALEGVLVTARTLAAPTGGRVVVLFGCGGDRDKGKRPEMGRIAATMADEVVVTSDNPRSEDPQAILDDVRAGILPTGRRAAYIVDRRAAIGEALRIAKEGDVVLIAGKGHETYQVIGDREEPFDDREVTKELLASASGARP